MPKRKTPKCEPCQEGLECVDHWAGALEHMGERLSGLTPPDDDEEDEEQEALELLGES